MPEVDEAAQAAASASVRLSEGSKDAISSRIADQFASAMNSDADDSPAVEEAAPAAPETEPAPTEEAEAAPEAPVTEAEAEVETEPAEAAAPAAPTLPAAYVRSLKRLEWTDEEITQALKSGGQGFVATAAKLHDSSNRDVARWADAGRKARGDKPAVTQAPVADVGLKPVDVAALRKEFGEEPLIDRLAGPVNDAINRINAILPVVNQYQQSTREAQLAKIGQQIDGFFASKELEPLREVYGTDIAKLSESQTAERQKVLELADAIIGGARDQGRNLSLDEALTMAADSLTSGVKETIARKKLVESLRPRARGISLKPGAKTNPGTPAGPANDRAALEKNTRQRLAALRV